MDESECHEQVAHGQTLTYCDCERDTRFRPAAEDRRVPALLEQTPGACDEAAETFPVMTVSFQQAPPAEPGYVPANRDQSAEPMLDTPPTMLICSPDHSSGAGAAVVRDPNPAENAPSAKATSARQRYAAVEGFIEGSWENRRNRCAPSLLHALSLVSLAVTVPRSSTHSCSSKHRSHSRNPAYAFSRVLPVSTRTAAASDADF